MAGSTSQPALGHTTLLFGPHFLSFTAESLSSIREDWVGSAGVQDWVLGVLGELPHHWTTLTTAFPALDRLQGEQQLRNLVESIRTGHISEASFPLSNLTLCPLVVVTQLTQYLHYRRLTQPRLDGKWVHMADTECVGFCIGVLSALAVSCSSTLEQLERNGATAVRLAMLIGALVDSANAVHPSGEPISISTVWHSPNGKAELNRVLESFPGAYVSVTYDENRATVTSPKKFRSSLPQKLKDAAINAVEIGLQGRFHDPESYWSVEDAIVFCDSHAAFALPDISQLGIRTRHHGDQFISEGSLHSTALRSILTEHCDWHQTFTATQARFADKEGSIISFGLERCVPPSYLRNIGHRLLHMADVSEGKPQFKLAPDLPVDAAKDYIAVIGLSCRVPGANDLEEFWDLLCENKSQHREVPIDRFSFQTVWRDNNPDRKWFGNFIEDFDAFDNKFFHRSPREAASMDPQQKMMLQAAYQAVQQSGYFRFQSTGVDKHIGCYIGVSNVDYQDNVACYPANAFTATGTLMSFVAGKVSHYFGWTGPAMSIDTACSGSAVAIHEACKSILSGECATALAGGVNAITSPLWFQNLAGASFLSPTGQCKPFAYNGDGYCRGEGVGAVVLKRLSNAIADGDQIFGVLAATAVHQNQNCTPITVPNSPSLSNLFNDVLHRAKIPANAVSVVEAHGTGTAVGDPAEYESILRVLGGPNRSDTLALRSVKGLVGHAECASGMVALVKTLLMIHEGTIAPQASHDAINPALNASESDKIEISTHLKPWNAQFKAALINNYGASGSNASMIVTEPPRRAKGTNDADTGRSPHQPFWVCGTDDQSLRAYASSLVSFLRSKKFSARDVSLSNLSFSLARQSNRSLPRGLIFHSPTIQDLEGQLLAFSQGGRDALDIEKASPPVILCFGGQVSTFVGLDRQVVERITVFKRHLDQCNIICKAMGLQGIYPEIFQREPIENIVKLQTALFALQYSCAMSWIECGVQVAAVVGHSFGEIVAHTVAGALTLADGLKIIARRARIIRDSWESDRGSMMAVEADVETVERVLARANGSLPSDRPATIACFNGPRSFTLAGSSASIQTVEAVLADDKALSASIRFKKLRTSHAFHSTLVETTLPDLEKVTEGIVFSEPRIHVETATEAPGTRPLSSTYIAEHLRQPVYFNHAIQRLGKQHSGAIWLEAGSQSTVTNMAAKALGMPPSSHFQPMNLTTDAAWQHLTEATVALWKRGLHVDFWPHHSSQTAQYPPLILPPYQFEKSRHFLDLKQPEPFSIKHSISDDQPLGLWSFVEYRGPGKQCARFRINTGHNTFQELMAGHTVAHSQPLCPSTLQLDIATESIRSLCPEFPISDFQLDLRDLENPSPLCRDHSRDVWLDATPLNSRQTWSWRIVSNPLGSDSGETLHASGRVLFRSRNDAEFLNEFGRFERLVTHKRCQEMLKGTDADDVIQGSAIYKLFADVVDYSEVFRGVRKVVGRENESAGRVVKKYSNDTWLDTPLCDSFCQVAGVFVNCMTQRPDGDACISTGVERVVRSPFIRNFEDTPEVFDVFALHERPTDRSFSSDVFIFDSRTSQLLGVILGIQYQRVSKLAMAKLLARLTPGAEQPRAAVTAFHPKSENVDPAPVENTSAPPAAADTGSSVKAKILAVLTEMVGVDPSKITDSTNLPDLGIDSLMGMEIARELELAFKCTFDSSSLMALVEFGNLVNCVRSAVGAGEDAESVPAVEAGHARTVVENADPSTASSSPPLSVAGFDETALPSDTDMSSRSASPKPDAKIAARQDAIEYFVGKYSKDFAFPSKRTGTVQCQTPPRCCVLITGATGSLGAHLVERFANLESVATVICFNRPSNMDPLARQHQALSERGIQLDEKASSKLHVISSDTSKPLLGLEETAYEKLVQEVTHIIHNAWPMSITRSISDFEKQFMAMRNLIDLARDASYKLPSSSKVGFQFISSIATVGLYPVVTGKTIVDEEPTSVQYALPSGYSDAKLVCEKLLSKTLLANGHRDRTDAMVVRVGQVAGSRTSGYWNPAEHLSLLVKSSKTLNAIPNLPGELSWLPVNDVAATLADLVLTPSPSQHESGVYHVENPTRQPWAEVVSLLAKELQIDQVIPYEEWLERVKEFPKEGTKENPAIKVITFLEKEFVRMACGGIVLGTEKARERSETLRTAGAIERDTIARFVRRWRESGFLA